MTKFHELIGCRSDYLLFVLWPEILICQLKLTHTALKWADAEEKFCEMIVSEEELEAFKVEMKHYAAVKTA